MSDFSRLEEKLAKLRQRERAPGEVRKLRGAGAEGLIAALVDEIDETILPRRLSLTIDKNTVIYLAVANRRLQALLAATPEIDGAAELVDRALPDADDPAVPAMKNLLEKVFTTAGTVEVSATRYNGNFGSEIGVPANLLARAWNVTASEERERDPAAVLSSFLGGIGDNAVAWLRIEGEAVTDQDGPAERVAALSEQAAVFLDGYFAQFHALFPEDSLACGTIIMPGGGKSLAAFFVEIGEVSAFVAAESSRMPAVAGHWQSLVAD